MNITNIVIILYHIFFTFAVFLLYFESIRYINSLFSKTDALGDKKIILFYFSILLGASLCIASRLFWKKAKIMNQFEKGVKIIENTSPLIPIAAILLATLPFISEIF